MIAASRASRVRLELARLFSRRCKNVQNRKRHFPFSITHNLPADLNDESQVKSNRQNLLVVECGIRKRGVLDSADVKKFGYMNDDDEQHAFVFEEIENSTAAIKAKVSKGPRASERQACTSSTHGL